jgi:hypothetical protein
MEQRNPIFKAGKYTVHHGKLSLGDSRDYWIEGPTVTGRMAPIASCYNEGDAIRRAKDMAARDTADTEEEARAKASEAFHAHPSNPSSCSVWEEWNRGSRCPCEMAWANFMRPEVDPAAGV